MREETHAFHVRRLPNLWAVREKNNVLVCMAGELTNKKEALKGVCQVLTFFQSNFILALVI